MNNRLFSMNKHLKRYKFMRTVFSAHWKKVGRVNTALPHNVYSFSIMQYTRSKCIPDIMKVAAQHVFGGIKALALKYRQV